MGGRDTSGSSDDQLVLTLIQLLANREKGAKSARRYWLPTAVLAEIRQRGRSELLDGLAVQPLDGTRLVPQILMAAAATGVPMVAMMVWIAALVSSDTEPQIAFWKLGVAILVAVFLGVRWVFVLVIRAARVKMRSERSSR